METRAQNPVGVHSSAARRSQGLVQTTGWLLCAIACGACGSAPNVDFWSQPNAGPANLVFDPTASSGGSGGSSGSSGGSTIAAVGGATAGAAGGTGSAGGAGGLAGGSAGAPPLSGEAPIAMKSLIDNMETDVSTIPEHDGRAGVWYTFNDGQGGTQHPSSGGPFLPDLMNDGLPGSARARRTHGGGFSSYAGFGFDLNKHGSNRQAYDASSYGGIMFWMQSNVSVRVLFPTRATAPVNEGGDCVTACNDSYGRELAPTAAWTEHSVSFAELHQLGAAGAASFDPKTLLGIAFSVTVGADFDVWIDDIGFY